MANTETRDVTVRIDADELASLRTYHLKVLDDIVAAQESKKSITKTAQENIDKYKSIEAETRKRLQTEEKTVQMECIWKPNYDTGNMVLHRPDTWEVLETRPLTMEERNLPLFDGSPSAIEAASGVIDDIARESEAEAAALSSGKKSPAKKAVSKGNGNGKPKPAAKSAPKKASSPKASASRIF